MGVWVYSYLSCKTITRLISLLSCVMRPPACENNYVNYFFFQHDIDNNNDCNYAMYCCNIAVCRSEAVATLYYTCARARAHTHTHISSCVRAGMTQFALVVAVILKCSTFVAVISEYSTVGVVFPLASLLSSLYWPWDPLSSLESTPVSI